MCWRSYYHFTPIVDLDNRIVSPYVPQSTRIVHVVDSNSFSQCTNTVHSIVSMENGNWFFWWNLSYQYTTFLSVSGVSSPNIYWDSDAHAEFGGVVRCTKEAISSFQTLIRHQWPNYYVPKQTEGVLMIECKINMLPPYYKIYEYKEKRLYYVDTCIWFFSPLWRKSWGHVCIPESQTYKVQ